MARENCSGCGHKKNSSNLYGTHIHNKIAVGVFCRACYRELFSLDPAEILVEEDWNKVYQPLGNDFLPASVYAERIQTMFQSFANHLFTGTDSEPKYLASKNKEHCVWSYINARDGSKVIIAGGLLKEDNLIGYFVTLFPWKNINQYLVVAEPVAA